jgi:hypothetical protein
MLSKKFIKQHISRPLISKFCQVLLPINSITADDKLEELETEFAIYLPSTALPIYFRFVHLRDGRGDEIKLQVRCEFLGYHGDHN